jgi:hypothetical protein
MLGNGRHNIRRKQLAPVIVKDLHCVLKQALPVSPGPKLWRSKATIRCRFKPLNGSQPSISTSTTLEQSGSRKPHSLRS